MLGSQQNGAESSFHTSPCPQCRLSMVRIPHQSGAFVTTGETLRHVVTKVHSLYQSSLSLSLRVEHPMGLEKCLMTPARQYHIVQNYLPALRLFWRWQFLSSTAEDSRAGLRTTNLELRVH